MKSKSALQLAVVILVFQALAHGGIVWTGITKAHTLEQPLTDA